MIYGVVSEFVALLGWLGVEGLEFLQPPKPFITSSAIP